MKTIQNTYLLVSDSLGDDATFAIECQPTEEGVDVTFTIGMPPNIFQYTETQKKGSIQESELLKLSFAIQKMIETYRENK
jgi:hypothetical protein